MRCCSCVSSALCRFCGGVDESDRLLIQFGEAFTTAGYSRRYGRKEYSWQRFRRRRRRCHHHLVIVLLLLLLLLLLFSSFFFLFFFFFFFFFFFIVDLYKVEENFKAIQYLLALLPSLCPSNACALIKRDNLLPTFLYHMIYRSFQFFRHEEWLVGDGPFYRKFWPKLTHPFQKRRLPVDIRP